MFLIVPISTAECSFLFPGDVSRLYGGFYIALACKLEIAKIRDEETGKPPRFGDPRRFEFVQIRLGSW